jgi:hypothetical protein
MISWRGREWLLWVQAVGKRVRAEKAQNGFLYWLLPIAVASTFGFPID